MEEWTLSPSHFLDWLLLSFTWFFFPPVIELKMVYLSISINPLVGSNLGGVLLAASRHISISPGIGRKQIWQSSLAGGSLNSASSCSSAARRLHSILWVAQCFLWPVASRYLTSIHDLHVLRLMPTPSTPQSAQQAAGADLAHPTGHVPPSSSVPFDQ